jgi:hypothetical protein
LKINLAYSYKQNLVIKKKSRCKKPSNKIKVLKVHKGIKEKETKNENGERRNPLVDMETK